MATVPEDDLIRNAEREVIDAAIAWDRESRADPGASEATKRLRLAIYMLSRTKRITGSIRIADVEQALAERNKRPKDE